MKIGEGSVGFFAGVFGVRSYGELDQLRFFEPKAAMTSCCTPCRSTTHFHGFRGIIRLS